MIVSFTILAFMSGTGAGDAVDAACRRGLGSCSPPGRESPSESAQINTPLLTPSLAEQSSWRKLLTKLLPRGLGCCRRRQPSTPCRTGDSCKPPAVETPGQSAEVSGMAQPHQPSIQHALCRRQQLLLIGTGHACLVLVRRILARDSNVWHTPWALLHSDTMKTTPKSLHKWLAAKIIVLNPDQAWMLDKPFLEYDRCISLSLLLSFCMLVLMCAAWVFGKDTKHVNISRVCSFAGGICALASIICILQPNYALLTNLSDSFSDCGKDFGRFMKFTSSSMFGMVLVLPLGLRLWRCCSRCQHRPSAAPGSPWPWHGRRIIPASVAYSMPCGYWHA